MIYLMFNHLNEKILVEINGDNIYFSSTEYGAVKAKLENLKLSYHGVLKEFPDLKDESDWQKIAIERFYKKFALLNSEEEKSNYVITDLKKFGYVPLYKQVPGFRVQKI